MNMEGHFPAGGWQYGKSWNGNGYVIAGAHGVNNHLIGMARNELSAKMGNHEGIVLRRVLCMSDVAAFAIPGTGRSAMVSARSMATGFFAKLGSMSVIEKR